MHIDAQHHPVGEALGEPSVVGMLSVRLRVGLDGRVCELKHLVDTLVGDPALLPAGIEPDEVRS